MCSLLMTMFIVGAVEVTPGVMAVDLLDTDKLSLTNGSAVETIYMKTNDYLDCWR